MFVKKFIVFLIGTTLTFFGLLGASMIADKVAIAASQRAVQLPDKPPIFVEMKPMLIPIIGENGTEEVISLLVSLEVPDQDTADKIKGVLPRLNDAFFKALYGAFQRGSIKKGDLVDIPFLKQLLRDTSIRVLGADTVDNVLVQALAQRRI